MSGRRANRPFDLAIGCARKVVRGDSPIHAVLLTLVTQTFVVLLNVGTGVMTARLLGPDGRGIFTATTIWPQFLAGVGALGLPAAIIYQIRNEPQRDREIIGAAYLVTLLVSFGATVAGLILAPITMSDESRGAILLAEFCILWTWTNMLSVTLRQIMVANGCFRAFARSSYLPSLLFLVGLLIAWPVFGMSAKVAAVCLMLSSLLSMGWMFVFVNSIVRPRFFACGPWLMGLLQYAAKCAATDVSGTLLGFIDRLILIPFLPPAELGLYVVAYSLSRVMLVLQTATGSVLYPAMAGRATAEIKDLHDLAFRLMLYSAFGAAAVTSAVAYPALTIVYGQDFGDALPLLRILVFEAAITCVGQVVVQLYLSLKQPGFPSMAQTLSLVVAAFSLLLLVPHYGAIGAAIALLIATIVRFTVLLVGIRMRLGMRMPRLLPQIGDVAYVQTRLL